MERKVQEMMERFDNTLGKSILVILQKLAHYYKHLVPLPGLSGRVGVISCIALKELEVPLHIDYL